MMFSSSTEEGYVQIKGAIYKALIKQLQEVVINLKSLA